jgi:hypothetical protein
MILKLIGFKHYLTKFLKLIFKPRNVLGINNIYCSLNISSRTFNKQIMSFIERYC